MPFHDVFRSIYGIDTTEPSKDQLTTTCELISFLFIAKGVVAVFGPEMKPSGNTLEQDLSQIKTQIETQPYTDYNYGIRLDFKENWEKCSSN